MEGPEDLLIDQELKFEFKSSSSQVEYEALIVDMVLDLEMGASRLKGKNNSQLATNQVSGQYQAKEPQLIKHLHKVRTLFTCF